jgi:hypothetical protein
VKKVVPIAVYRNGIRYVVAEAMVEVPDDTQNLHKLEVDITEPQLTMIRESVTENSFSLPKES